MALCSTLTFHHSVAVRTVHVGRERCHISARGRAVRLFARMTGIARDPWLAHATAAPSGSLSRSRAVGLIGRAGGFRR
jgi:hypothetical protein